MTIVAVKQLNDINKLLIYHMGDTIGPCTSRQSTHVQTEAQGEEQIDDESATVAACRAT